MYFPQFRGVGVKVKLTACSVRTTGPLPGTQMASIHSVLLGKATVGSLGGLLMRAPPKTLGAMLSLWSRLSVRGIQMFRPQFKFIIPLLYMIYYDS